MVMTEDNSQLLLLPAVLFALAGLLIAGGVTRILCLNGLKDAKDVTAVAGVFTGMTGTLVGTPLGVEVDTTGAAKLQDDRDQTVSAQGMAAARLSPATGRSLRVDDISPDPR